MLSKEEIKHILDANVDILTYKADKDFRCLTSTEKVLLENNEKIKEYIEDLESREQKLIEKLEKRKNKNNNKYCQSIDNDEFPEMYEYGAYVKEDNYILSILKGENHE